MPNVLIYKARALKPQTRAAVEAELGRSLKDDEDVSIMAFGTHEAPAGEARSRVGQKLEAGFRRIDKKTASGSNETAEATFQQALKKVRPESES
jgi:diketogulonate reductase-like aldo/keto reductase